MIVRVYFQAENVTLLLCSVLFLSPLVACYFLHAINHQHSQGDRCKRQPARMSIGKKKQSKGQYAINHDLSWSFPELNVTVDLNSLRQVLEFLHLLLLSKCFNSVPSWTCSTVWPPGIVMITGISGLALSDRIHVSNSCAVVISFLAAKPCNLCIESWVDFILTRA